MPKANIVTSYPETQISPWMRSATLVLLAVLIFGAIPLWYETGSFHAMGGDDLRSFLYIRNGGANAFNEFLIQHHRYRPVMVFLETISADWTNGDYNQIKLLSAGIHTLNALLLLWMLTHSIRLPMALAVGLMIIAAFSRFTNYLLMAETGLIESAGITLCLLYLWAILHFLRNPRMLTVVILASLYWLIIHLHERYLALLAPGTIAGILVYRKNRIPAISLLVLGPAIATGNVLIKKLVLGAPVLMGTTTQAIDSSVAPKVTFFLQGIVNLLGINRGPSYLSVLDYLASPLWLKAVSWISATAAVFITFGALSIVLGSKNHASHRSIQPNKAAILILGTTVVCLVLSASVTFRQEYRWLYPGYLAFLLLLAAATQTWSTVNRSLTPYLMIGGLTILGISRELGIRDHASNFYQYSTCRTASALYNAIARSDLLQMAPVITIGGDPVPDHDWVFMDGMFSEYYRLPPLQFRDSTVTPSNPPLLRYDAGKHEFYEYSHPPDRGTPLPYNVDTLNRAELLNGFETDLSTPNGRRLFPFTFDGTGGLALVAPLELQVEVPPGAEFLHISFSHLWRSGGNILVEITVNDGSGNHPSILTATIPRLMVSEKAEWHNFQLPIPIASKSLHIQAKPINDASATWLQIRQFTFSQPGHTQ